MPGAATSAPTTCASTRTTPREEQLMIDSTIDERIRRAEVLIEALPYIRRFSGHVMVIKLGGAAAAGGDIDSVLQDVVLLRFVGLRPVIVPGGGQQISAWQDAAGTQPP